MFVLIALVSCKKDDDDTDVVLTPPRDRGEVQLESDAAIVEYLNTHTYNYEEFDSPPEGFDYKIKFSPLVDSASKTPLIDDVHLRTETFTFQEVKYNLYVLESRKGEGKPATYADSVFIKYKGQLLDDTVFDQAGSTPVWFNLPGILTQNGPDGGTIFGFANAYNGFNGATMTGLNDDGTLQFSDDYGVGAVFIPAGLGYFSSTQGLIPAYSSLIFTFQVFDAVVGTDGDGDGVPNLVEDVNNNKTLTDDNTDGDRDPNFLDLDDDNDGKSTRSEIIINEDGSVTYPDTDKDGTPDYLDADS